MLFRSRPCIFLGIVKQSKANTVEVARAVKEEVARIRETLPPGIEMVFNYDESIFVEASTPRCTSCIRI